MHKTFGVLLALIPTATILGTAIAQATTSSAAIAFDVGVGETRNGNFLCGTYSGCGRILATSRIYNDPFSSHYCESDTAINGKNFTLGTTQTWTCFESSPGLFTQAVLKSESPSSCFAGGEIFALGNKTTSWTAVSTANTLNNSDPTKRIFSVSANSNCSNPHANSFRGASWGL